MIGEKSKVENQAVQEGKRGKMPETPDFSKLVRLQQERRTLTRDVDLGGSATIPKT